MLIRVTTAEVWLSPFFHWKKGCELSATADARDDDSSNAGGKQKNHPVKDGLDLF